MSIGLMMALAEDEREARCLTPGERWCRHTPLCSHVVVVIGGLSDLKVAQPGTTEPARNALMEIVAERQGQKLNTWQDDE